MTCSRSSAKCRKWFWSFVGATFCLRALAIGAVPKAHPRTNGAPTAAISAKSSETKQNAFDMSKFGSQVPTIGHLSRICISTAKDREGTFLWRCFSGLNGYTSFYMGWTCLTLWPELMAWQRSWDIFVYFSVVCLVKGLQTPFHVSRDLRLRCGKQFPLGSRLGLRWQAISSGPSVRTILEWNCWDQRLQDSEARFSGQSRPSVDLTKLWITVWASRKSNQFFWDSVGLPWYRHWFWSLCGIVSFVDVKAQTYHNLPLYQVIAQKTHRHGPSLIKRKWNKVWLFVLVLLDPQISKD